MFHFAHICLAILAVQAAAPSASSMSTFLPTPTLSYYALLNVTEAKPRVGLTLSVGPGWEGTEPSQRSWVQLNVWSEDHGTQLNIRDPKESNFFPWEKGGRGLTRDEAKLSSAIEEIWAVADFIVDSDPAVSSYLDSKPVITEGREVRRADHPSRNC